MLPRFFAIIAAVALVMGCGGAEEETKREGVKASAAAKPEQTEEAKQIQAKLAGVSETASQSLEHEEVVKAPVATEYYLLSDAFEASGFRWEALRRKVEEKETEGKAYVKLTLYNDLPEVADIYDDMGNHLNIVAYLWDNEFNIYGSVYKSANDRMLGMFLYCKTDDQLFVHSLSTFRVHAPHTLKITSGEGSVLVEMLDGHSDKGELPIWPKCEELEKFQAAGKPYQSPFGVHKQVFNFDAVGNLLASASYDLKGGLVEDIRGIAKTEIKWSGDRMIEESLYTADDLLSRYTYEYDEEGNLVRKSVVNKEGKPARDYFGVAYYEYEYDRRHRVTKETRKDVTASIYEVHEYEYGKFNQVAGEKVFDGQGTLQTVYQRNFNKKGALLDYSIFDGDPAAGKLKLDANGVALYRYVYTDKGRLVEESHHGTTQVVDAEGKQDYLFVNDLDGWARIVNTYDEDKRKVVSTQFVRVDGNGNAVFEEVTDKEGELDYRIERTFAGNIAATIVKTDIEKGLPVKKIYMDGSEVVQRVALLQHNSDGLLMEEAFFAEDEKTAALAPDGYHKMVRSYTEDQKPKSEAYFDVNGNKVKTVVFEYKEDGSLAGTKAFDAEGKEIR